MIAKQARGSWVEAASASKTLPEFFKCATEVVHPGKVFAFPKTYGDFEAFDTQQIAQYAVQGATFYNQHGLPRTKGKTPSVVAICSRAKAEWMFTFWSLIILGHTVLAVSPRLPAEPVNHLLKKSGAQCLIYDQTPPGGLSVDCAAIPMASLADLAKIQLSDAAVDQFAIPEPLQTDVAYYVHSSGSTGLPKLIPKTHLDFMKTLKQRVAAYGQDGVYVASAVYNGVGLDVALVSMILPEPVYFENDFLPLTAEGSKQFLCEANPKLIFITPFALSCAAATPEGMEVLRRANSVGVIGAVCPDTLGDRLVREGVRFESAYGKLETGHLMSSGYSSGIDDSDWAYMAPFPHLNPHIEFQPRTTSVDGTRISSRRGNKRNRNRDDDDDDDDEEEEENEEQLYELVIRSTYPALQKQWANSDNPPGSHHTGDLFQKHPSKPNRWKIVGRTDDVLRISTPDRPVEITATAYETQIQPLVSDVATEVVLFGQGREKPGLLIFCGPASSPAVVLDRVWNVVSKYVNGRVRIPIEKGMLKVVPGTNMLPLTSKSNFIRAQVYSRYADLIENVYQTAPSVKAQVSK